MGGLATLAILLAATVSASDVDVRATAGGRVTLRVASAPLSEVLDRLSRQIGMKVIYDGQPPRTVVRGRQVEDATPADALANILEGLGVSYALRLDATGAKVETLLILGAAGGSVGTSSVGTTASTAMPVTRPGLPTTRVPRAPRVAPPVAADDEGDDEVSQEAAGEEAVILRPGQEPGDDAPVRPPGAPAGPPNFPGMNSGPAGPIAPLSMPTPPPAPQPSPPPVPPS